MAENLSSQNGPTTIQKKIAQVEGVLIPRCVDKAAELVELLLTSDQRYSTGGHVTE